MNAPDLYPPFYYGICNAVCFRRRLRPAAVDARDMFRREPTSPKQLFFVLNTESSFALGVGDAIAELEEAHAGMGQALYDSLRQSLYRWIRVYDDMDARKRIEQMTEWAEGEDDPESYEIPKLEQDLPPCLKAIQCHRKVRS